MLVVLSILLELIKKELYEWLKGFIEIIWMLT